MFNDKSSCPVINGEPYYPGLVLSGHKKDEKGSFTGFTGIEDIVLKKLNKEPGINNSRTLDEDLKKVKEEFIKQQLEKKGSSGERNLKNTEYIKQIRINKEAE